MYELNFEEMIVVAKMIAYSMGDRSVILTDMDKNISFELMKKMIDQRLDMNKQQKEQFKIMLDLYKHIC
jgi:hypothetical protein